VLAREGDPDNASLSTMLGPKGAALVFDLQVDASLSAALLQASAEATVLVELSADQVGWQPFWQAGPMGSAEAGLRTRMATGLDGHGRYLRVRPVSGQGAIALSELQVFCRRPPVLDVEVRPAVVAPAAAQLVRWQAWRKLLIGLCGVFCFVFLWPGRSARAQLVGACLALLGACWPCISPSVSRARQRWRLRCYCSVAGRGVGRAGRPCCRAWFRLAGPRGASRLHQFGLFAGYWSIHYHDAAHYFLGAKYAPELGYTRLYDCLATAAWQEQRWPSDARQPVRDLRSNKLRSLSETLNNGSLCTTGFTPSRWADFRRDVVFFQSQLHPAAWGALLTDHGYNATPVWTWLLRTTVLRDRQASLAWLATLSQLDDVGYGLLLLCLLWVSACAPGCWGL